MFALNKPWGRHFDCYLTSHDDIKEVTLIHIFKQCVTSREGYETHLAEEKLHGLLFVLAAQLAEIHIACEEILQRFNIA